jgi:chromate transporter
LKSNHRDRPVKLAELAFAFLKLGTIAFGGPAAHIAMMEDEFVRKRQWITHAEFLDRLGAANLIPGPSSTEVAIFIGYSARGFPGLLIAGGCFIIPAMVLVTAIAAAYVRYASLPQVAGILFAVKPVVIAIVVQALWNLGRKAVKSKLLAFAGIVALPLSFLGIDPLIVLAATGMIAAGSLLIRKANQPSLHVLPVAWFGFGAAALDTVPVSVLRLFLAFLKIGAIIFGSGYVLLVFLRTEFITKLHWLTEHQLIDAVAVGQFTPGPVFTTATFIGYLVAGIPGALSATLGIFLPGFILVAISGPLIPKIRRSPLASAILDGVVVGSLALMAIVAWQLGRSAIVSWLTLLLAVVSFFLLVRFKISPAWLIGGAAIVGIFLNL